nr:hypothetical protein GCM10025730_19390 [Promicromonospora thailandica]
MSENPQLLPAVSAFLSSPKQLLIDGEWVEAKDGQTFATVNPATEETLVQVAQASAVDADRAVTAARNAFEAGPWSRMSPRDRSHLLWRIGDMIEERAEEFAQLESLDNGKSLASARGDVGVAAELFRYFAGWATKMEGTTIPMSVPGKEFHAYTRREAIGVVAGIVPWNFPLTMAAFKIVPSITAGNTIVLKPAEQTPLTALRLGELLLEAGVPAGVVNVLPGFGDAGAALVDHHGVDKVAFTGSTEVGKKIAAGASRNLKKVSLELGGKAPNIIFADADLDAAIAGAALAGYFNEGQCCVNGSRLYVQREVFDQVIEGWLRRPRPSAWATPSTRPPRWARWSRRSSTRRSWATCAVRWPTVPRSRRAAPTRRPTGATSSPRRSSPTSPSRWRCRPTRSSARSSRPSRSTARTRWSRRPTTRSTAWPRACGRATWAPRTGWAASCGPARSG